MEGQGEYDANAAVHAPKQHANLLFWGRGEGPRVQEELPVEGPTLHPERGIEKLAVGAISSDMIKLQVMPFWFHDR